MKKTTMRVALIAATAIALMVSCSKELETKIQRADKAPITFHAFDAEAQNKTILSGSSILWKPGDQIAVYQGSDSAAKFTSTATNICATTDFTGTLSYIIGGQESSPESSNIWAVYPYTAACGCDGNSVTFSVDAEQTALAGTFASGIFPSVAKSKSYSLAFYNVCGGIKFTVAQHGIQKVILHGNNSEKLAGKVTVRFSDGIPLIDNINDSNDSIIVSAPDLEGFIPGNDYYIVTVPAAFPNGFTITYVDNYGKTTFSSKSNANIKRKTFGILSQKDTVGILFRDSVAKAVCVEQFDRNSDGEVSFAEASIPTSLDGLFENNSELQYFTELKYFTSVKDLKGCFNSCVNLQEIEIPDFITSIGEKSFFGCSSLTEISIPSSVKDLGTKAFFGCDGICEISIPHSVKTIGNESFRNCSSLKAINMAEGVETIGNMSFYGISARTVTLPSSITSIGTKAFWNEVEEIILNGVTPPSRSELSFGTSTFFYVPDEALSTYKNADVWAYFDECIFPVSEYITNLSIEGAANCYIVSTAGNYSFTATVKGGSKESLETPASAVVLWETFGTDVTPNVGDIVRNVHLSNGDVVFSTPAKLNNGNAVIAVMDNSGEILWSWHIWVCSDFDPVKTAQVYNNNAGTMMDRNLGATSANPGDIQTLGLLYQWGRKDPFLNGSALLDATVASSTLEWPSYVTPDKNTGTIQYTITHPTTFISGYFDARNKIYNGDWYYTGTSTTDETRWRPLDKDKGIYDPCPNGWRVPDGGSSGIWATAFGSSNYFYPGPWDSTNHGFNFGSSNGHAADHQLGSDSLIWYPAAGSRSYNGGNLSTKYYGGNYWASNGSEISMDWDTEQSYVRPNYSYWKANGFSVRCCKE